MKFYSGRQVLRFWYNFGYAVKNYSLPAIFIREDDEVTPPQFSPENCDYPQWWYAWIDIDKIINSLSDSDHILIVYYFNKVHDKHGEMARWDKRHRFYNMCDRIYEMLPVDEYRGERKQYSYEYRDVSQTLDYLVNKIEEGVIVVDLIEKDKMYTSEEVAEILRLHIDTVRRLLKSGEIEGHKFKKWLVPGSSLIKILGGGNERK